jgi:plastocyanin
MHKPRLGIVRAGLLFWIVLHAFSPSQAAVVEIVLCNCGILPDTVTVTPGDVVRWSVVSGIHQAQNDTDSFKSWDTGLLDTSSADFDLPFTFADGPGPFAYHCTRHGRAAAILVADTCFATGSLSDTLPPTVADMVTAVRVISGDLPPPDNLYRLDLTGDCIVDYRDAEALSDWFQIGPGSIDPYPVPTCCFPDLQSPGCPVVMTGDVDETGRITSSDVIFMVHVVFKAGNPAFPCPAAGDVNCSGTITSADIIYLVNFVFKAGPIPCDVCTLVPDVWTCP